MISKLRSRVQEAAAAAIDVASIASHVCGAGE